MQRLPGGLLNVEVVNAQLAEFIPVEEVGGEVLGQVETFLFRPFEQVLDEMPEAREGDALGDGEDGIGTDDLIEFWWIGRHA